MDVLILGCNRLTAALAPDLAGSGHNVTVLGKERECLEQVEDGGRVRVIWAAEPTMQDYLRQGGIDTAETFLALSGNDHENVLTAQVALHIFNVPKVVCHISDPKLQIFYSGLGLDVVGPSFGILQDVRQAIEA
jgi:trk system potassium uptake protein TrkA